MRSHLSTAWLWYLVISLHEIKYLQTHTKSHTTVDTTYCPQRNTQFHFGLLLLNSNFHNLKSLTSSRHCSDHSGFHFPWFRSPQAHDYHHKVNKSHHIKIIIQPACFGAGCHIEMAKSPPLPSEYEFVRRQNGFSPKNREKTDCFLNDPKNLMG